jgi:hypothetical protein
MFYDLFAVFGRPTKSIWATLRAIGDWGCSRLGDSGLSAVARMFHMAQRSSCASLGRFGLSALLFERDNGQQPVQVGLQAIDGRGDFAGGEGFGIVAVAAATQAAPNPGADPAPAIHYAPAENLEHVGVALIDTAKLEIDLAAYVPTDWPVMQALTSARSWHQGPHLS